MLNFRDIPLRRKQTLIMMLTSTITLLLACVAFVGVETSNFRNELSDEISTMAQIAGNNCAAALDFNDPKAAEDTLGALRVESPIANACVYNRRGEVFAVYQRDKSRRAEFPLLQPPGREFRDNQLRIFLPIIMQGEQVGTTYVTCDLSELDYRLKRSAVVAMLVLGISLLVAFFLSMRLQRVVSGPVLQLAQAVQTVALEKNYSVRATKQSNDELGQLVDGFNEMLTQIQQREAALQSARDNLERRVEERTAELAESQSLYHSLVDQMPAGVFRKDAEDRFVFVNSWYCRLKGMKPEQILGKTPMELATNEFLNHPEATKEIQLAVQGADNHKWIMETGKRIDVEEQYPGADGKIQFWQVVKSPVFGPDGKIIGTQGIFFDITERKRADAELSYERELLRALLDHSPDSIYFKDAQSRFLKTSESQVRLFGMKSVDDLIGKSDFDFFTDEHARPAFEDEQEIIRTGVPLIDKVEKETLNDGRERWALTSKMPLRNQNGQITGTFGISKDITAIKEAEAKLEQVHKQLLETSRQAGMAEIATNILHNVGNVLNSVNISASLVADSAKKSKAANLSKVVAMLREHEHDLGAFITGDAKGKQLPIYLAQLSDHLLADQKATIEELDSLLKNIEHIKDIVSVQQDYARVSGITELINVGELVEDSLRMNVDTLDRHHVEVIREFEDVPLINIDKHKVLQILINLIRNAKHACQDSARTDKRLTVRVADGDGRIKISVIDNGIGIPPENLTRIFNHGFTTRKGGHGFGLHTGALAAKELGGSLNVQSDGIGLGATFTLELPLT